MTTVNPSASKPVSNSTRNESAPTPARSDPANSSSSPNTQATASNVSPEWQGQDRFEAPHRTPATVNTTANSATITASNRDDVISVTKRSGGGLNVSVNGHRTQLNAAQAQNLTINAGDGNDRVYVLSLIHI